MISHITVKASNIQGTGNTQNDMVDNLGNLIFQQVWGASFSGAGITYDLERGIATVTVSTDRLSGQQPAQSQYSQLFTAAQSPSAQAKTAWTAFRQSLTGTYTTFTWSSTNGSSITVTDPVKVQQIANALRTATIGTNFSVVIGANTWRVVTGCSAVTVTAESVEFTNDNACSCGGLGKYTIRPFISNANWGGTNQSTCGAGTQTITISFS